MKRHIHLMNVVKLAAGIFDAAGKQFHPVPVEFNKVEPLQIPEVVCHLFFRQPRRAYHMLQAAALRVETYIAAVRFLSVVIQSPNDL